MDKLIYSLRDDFFLLKKIKQGGFGKVYKVIEKKTGKIYAAKLIKINDGLNGNFHNILYFSREMSILSTIKHKAIIKIKYYSKTDFNNDQCPVIITKYMEKGSLSTILEQIRYSRTVPGWNGTIKLINIYGIASAMSYLHSQNIEHRHLNPYNILLDNSLHPKVEFIGLSFQKKQNNDVAPYIAPEIWTDYKYSQKNDVYSYGIIVHEILTNSIPFEERNIFQIMIYVSQGKQPLINKDIPASYANLIKRCLAHEPQERPTFDEILNLLKNDEGFITNVVDENEYRNYVYYIDH